MLLSVCTCIDWKSLPLICLRYSKGFPQTELKDILVDVKNNDVNLFFISVF